METVVKPDTAKRSYVMPLRVLLIFLKGRVHYFTMQVVLNKCFLLNPKKNFWRRFVLSFSKKNAKNHTLIPKNDVTELNARLL